MDKKTIESFLYIHGITIKSWKSFEMQEEDYEGLLETLSIYNLNPSLVEEAFDSFDDIDGRYYHIHKRFKTWDNLISFFES